MKEVKSITLVLENCETIKLDRKHIGSFLVDNIKYSISRMACNSISTFTFCENFAIEINRNASKVGTNYNSNQDALKRLITYSDITAIDIKYEDDTEEYIYVDWNEENNHCNNNNQKHYMNKFGDLYIVVSSGKVIDDYFDIEEIEDEEDIDFTWVMYEE